MSESIAGLGKPCTRNDDGFIGDCSVTGTQEVDPTTHEGVDDECLLDLLRAQVIAWPERPAAVHGGDVLSFRALVERSTILAAYLRHLGVRADACVAMFVEPSLDLMVGAWGILFAGGAYLPLSPEYPEERLRYMLEDSRAGVIFAQGKLRARLEGLAPAGAQIVTMDDAAAFARSGIDAIDRAGLVSPRPNHLAYVIYTSGSTGKPKGVMIEHRSIVNQMRWLGATYGINHERIVLQKTPMSFDAAQWEILAPSCGSQVIMGDPGVHRDPERLIELVERHRVTTLQCVPTLLQALLDTDVLDRCSSLTQVFCGGEALSRSLALRCLAALPACELVNLYGPTECTINSSAHRVDPRTVAGGPSTISIGSPVDHTRYYVLDGQRAPTPPGEVGELYVAGVQLARGYLHRPDLTAERFVENPSSTDPRYARLYKTGDLVHENPDGTMQFIGRADNQVKLRGFRIELDEIRLAIEAHGWVKNAAVIVKDDPRTGFQNLIALLELNPKEAALMDQGNHGAHHQSKEGKLQLKAQLSNLGCREATELLGKPVIDLPGKTPTPEQRRQVFRRKTYRFFEGGDVTKADILRLLARKPASAAPRPLDLSFAELGKILRYFGQYLSDERLLPKYAYASPGSLYATQLYLEMSRIGSLTSGCYYYHPIHHQLILIRERAASPTAEIKLHFVGKRRAIEPVYKNNIQEVLEIEAGHMVGLLEEILPGFGLTVRDLDHDPAVIDNLECASEDYYLGTFEITPFVPPAEELVDVYVQAHPGKVADLPAGQYQYQAGSLRKISDELVQKRHVIAINQQVYERSSIGITVISKTPRRWRSYLDLGRKLQRLQMNGLGLGFMSSGYSSKTGNDLPSARRMESILNALGMDGGPSYFFVGGRVGDDQLCSEGMKEDLVHMKGPAEMIKEDLANVLADYMIPNKVIVLDKLPLTANGKIDNQALGALDQVNTEFTDRPFVAPRTPTEERISEIWKTGMKRDSISVCDDFFTLGGNSLIAVGLINKINKEFHSALPVQSLFELPTIEQMALRVDGATAASSSRLVRLQADGTKPPIYCWPGLGGYTMNLRRLAGKLTLDQPFYGVQAYGINHGEAPYPTIKEMAAKDVEMIRQLQPTGPYTLWGYSFGARVAFEAAYQLEQSGARVEHLFLIAPGSPKLATQDDPTFNGAPGYGNKAYVTILASVFLGGITGAEVEACVATVTDEDSFVAFISDRFKSLGAELIRRITRVVYQTYEFKYSFRELAERTVRAPLTIFKAQGDDYSFLENRSGYSAAAPTIVDLEADHYGLLKDPSLDELVAAIRARVRAAG
jgi:amino acid adenylation domain-containing protein